MTQINNLATVDALSSGDQVPVYDESAGTARKASMAQVVEYLQQSFASPEFDVTISSPISGFNQVLAANSKSIWLILTPAGTLATGTVTLPPVASCFDGQTVMVSTTQIISALTVAGSGASVQGEPSVLPADGFFALRFNSTLSTWYNTSTVSTSTFSSITVIDDIILSGGGVIKDGDGANIVTIDTVENAVNSIQISNAITGADPFIAAIGSDTNIDLVLSPKGTGRIKAATGKQMEAQNFVAVDSFGGPLAEIDFVSATNVVASESVQTEATTVGALGAATNKGIRRFVTDATATTFASIVAGGGANNVPVYSDGTNWRIG